MVKFVNISILKLKPDSILIFGEILSVKKEHCSKLVKF